MRAPVCEQHPQTKDALPVISIRQCRRPACAYLGAVGGDALMTPPDLSAGRRKSIELNIEEPLTD
jgi:hypothetical protein